MARLGYKVVSLKRTSIGRISLERMAVGSYRSLTQAEIKYLLQTPERALPNFEPGKPKNSGKKFEK
jgi:16S rRNA U516 pseudouridylate synthase RsuA-like enzyme